MAKAKAAPAGEAAVGDTRTAAQESLRKALERHPGLEVDLGDVIAYLADEPATTPET